MTVVRITQNILNYSVVRQKWKWRLYRFSTSST